MLSVSRHIRFFPDVNMSSNDHNLMAHFRRNIKGILRGFGMEGQRRSDSGGLPISDINKNIIIII